MAREDPVPAYACMMQNADLRKVHEPSDERRMIRVSRVRRTVTRLAAALR